LKEKRVLLDGEERLVLLETTEGALHARIGDRAVEVRILSEEPGELLLSIDGRQVPVPYLRRGDSIYFSVRGETWEATIASPFQRKRGEKEHSLGAPMPGAVLRIHVAVGDRVARGESLVTLEAMKMEHQITAPFDGIVESISCSEGEMVQPGVDLIAVAPEGEGEQ
jgi:biotin carboxyl carrier protein